MQPVKPSLTFPLGGDLTVRRLGYGTMRLIPDGAWGRVIDPVAAARLLHRALDLGINFIDTADAYGPQELEPFLARTLSPYPDGLVIATKGGLARMGPGRSEPLGRPAYLHQQVEMSLRYLRLEQLPLWQLHRIDPNVSLEDSLGAIAELQQAGKIRHVGLSEVSVEQIEQARRILRIVSVQNKYSLTERKHDAVLDYCTRERIAFIPWYPVAAGKLGAPARGGDPTEQPSPLAALAARHGATLAQLSLAWLLQRSPVLLPIPGTSSIEHLEENLAAERIALTPDQWQQVEAAAAQPARP